MAQIREKVVVVTGGSSGIGEAIAAGFAHQSPLNRVIIIGRDKARLEESAVRSGANVTGLVADVSRWEQVARVVGEIVERHESVSVLVNAAGISGPTLTTRLSLEEAEEGWNQVIAINLTGSFLMSQAVAPYLTRSGGRIINLSSIAAFTGGSRAGSVGYAAAKSGVLGLTFGLARELGPEGITVNAIVPGLVTGTGFFGGPLPQQRLDGIVGQTPVGRAGQPEDIAALALFLASEEASFITGQALHVNGGWLFRH